MAGLVVSSRVNLTFSCLEPFFRVKVHQGLSLDEIYFAVTDFERLPAERALDIASDMPAAKAYDESHEPLAGTQQALQHLLSSNHCTMEAVHIGRTLFTSAAGAWRSCALVHTLRIRHFRQPHFPIASGQSTLCCPSQLPACKEASNAGAQTQLPSI